MWWWRLDWVFNNWYKFTKIKAFVIKIGRTLFQRLDPHIKLDINQYWRHQFNEKIIEVYLLRLIGSKILGTRYDYTRVAFLENYCNLAKSKTIHCLEHQMMSFRFYIMAKIMNLFFLASIFAGGIAWWCFHPC